MNIEKLKANYGDVRWYDRKRTLFGLPLSFTVYILTDKKFYVRTGLFNIKEINTDLYKITDYNLSLPLSQRIFGCGSIKVLAKDVDTPEYLIKSVKTPRVVVHTLDETVEAERSKYMIRGRDMFGAADGSPHHHGEF
ncbi:MAG: PH domain-containing protein [Oscillospiraceae bacterium]|jgi:hypothetical protein|nr:PH domain-containing protein [Oscillospiraceae bacterium]